LAIDIKYGRDKSRDKKKNIIHVSKGKEYLEKGYIVLHSVLHRDILVLTVLFCFLHIEK